MSAPRSETIARILGEIGRCASRIERFAARFRIEAARGAGTITERDAARLTALLEAAGAGHRPRLRGA